MSVTATELYWIFRIDQIKELLVGLIIISTFFSILSILVLVASLPGDNGKEDLHLRKRACPFIKAFVPTTLFFLLIQLFTPTSKQILAMKFAPPLINGIATNGEIQSIGEKSLDLIDAKLDEWLEHTKEKNK